jgi:hypothetical protein
LALGREHPDRLAICLDELEAGVQGRRTAPSDPPREAPREPPPPPPPAHAPSPSRRIKRLTIPARNWVMWMLGSAHPLWLNRLPASFRVVGDLVISRKQDGTYLTLTIQSSAFDEVAPGDPVPEVEWP